MNITLDNLRQLRKSCEFMTQLIKDIEKPISEIEPELKTLNDYKKMLKEKNLIPQNYYKFQMLDTESYISYNSRTKYYHIFLKGKYSNLLNNYTRTSENSYQISYVFDDVLHLWQDVIYDLLNTQVMQCGLF